MYVLLYLIDDHFEDYEYLTILSEGVRNLAVNRLTANNIIKLI